MVNTLSGSVCAYRKETVKPRFIRIDEVMALLDVTQDEAMDIALAAGARYQLAKIILVHKIGGRAKAMVVTPSRLHAVRYVQEFKRQIKEKGLNDLEVLVAFSGEVKDNDDVFTEEGMNKDKEGKTIKEKALPETFHTDDDVVS